VIAVENFEVGAVNRAQEVYCCASGNVLNVALALHQLSGASLAIAPLGGAPHDALDHEFEWLGVSRRLVASAPQRQSAQRSSIARIKPQPNS
jgi:fructose-1-phosphate kinase PfkB-like protein